MRTYAALAVAVVFLSSMLAACVTTERTYQGVGAGGGIGAAAGALLDKGNRWRGALVGGALGALLGGTVTELASRASQEAAERGRPVAYQSEDGLHRIEAAPVGYHAHTPCRQVRETVYQDGQLVQDQVKEICDGRKTRR
ncbi:MAG: glycine zipper 2TM domain-containing protein [Nitrospinae bacterium]|nr:glycine zipper 2TM domain-containing protein [Nitrospinota bacterium]